MGPSLVKVGDGWGEPRGEKGPSALVSLPKSVLQWGRQSICTCLHFECVFLEQCLEGLWKAVKTMFVLSPCPLGGTNTTSSFPTAAFAMGLFGVTLVPRVLGDVDPCEGYAWSSKQLEAESP